ncbi:hypothetical protein LI328DRAFT_40308 [Trichoderma asperelloides]|nr:hypothetical protein LI328DRAFT_40308 [Trichoderma asperelloides]
MPCRFSHGRRPAAVVGTSRFFQLPPHIEKLWAPIQHAAAHTAWRRLSQSVLLTPFIVCQTHTRSPWHLQHDFCTQRLADRLVGRPPMGLAQNTDGVRDTHLLVVIFVKTREKSSKTPSIPTRFCLSRRDNWVVLYVKGGRGSIRTRLLDTLAYYLHVRSPTSRRW